MIFRRRQPQPQQNIKPTLVTQLRNELTKPLSALDGLHDLMLKTELTKEQKRYVAAMMDSTFKLQQTVQTLTQVSQRQVRAQAQSQVCRVLVVESEPLSARLFKQTLAEYDIQHTLVASLPMAMTTLEHTFDTGQAFSHILVADDLPSVNARESLAYLQAALAPTTFRPELILTRRELKQRGHEDVWTAGYHAILTKPLRAAALLAYLGVEAQAAAQEA